MLRILIVGTGNLGKRHLQALSYLKNDFEVFCYDAFEEARNSVAPFCVENKITIDNLIVLDTLDAALDIITVNTVVIVVTTAKGRAGLLKDLFLKFPKAIISEKPICQTLEEYEELMALSHTYKVPVYVNFIAHMQSFYQEIKSEVKGLSNFVFYSNMPKWGIACVGIHHFELLTWMFDVSRFSIVNNGDYIQVYDQKRKGFQDMAGAVILRTDNNNLCVINNSEFEGLATIQINTEQKCWTIYELQKVMTVVDKELPGKVDVRVLDYKYVSQYTHLLVTSIMNNKMISDAILPDLKGSYLAHKMLFDALKARGAGNINIT
jgi:predicted dehydrogenase